MGYDAEIAVVGLGAMGAHAAWRLAARGTHVVAFEQFELGNDLGSSHGKTRIFRVACLEHPNLVPLARHSCTLWTELQAHSGDSILSKTGALLIGAPTSKVIAGTLAAARIHHLPVGEVTRSEILKQFPQHHDIAPDHTALWDPEAGLVYPEVAILAASQAARAAGAVIHQKTKVTRIECDRDGIWVSSAQDAFKVSQVVLTAGAWLGKLVPELPLRPARTMLTWFEPRNGSDEGFTLERFPPFIRAIEPGYGIWGHGSGDRFGVKIGLDRSRDPLPIDPDASSALVGTAAVKDLSASVAELLPGLTSAPTRVTPCMSTYSPDGLFQIGRLRRDPRLIVGGGCSGHAFKHAGGIGELIAQIALGETPLTDAGFIDPNRFL
jgi:sarcosine oxidase